MSAEYTSIIFRKLPPSFTLSDLQSILGDTARPIRIEFLTESSCLVTIPDLIAETLLAVGEIWTKFGHKIKIEPVKNPKILKKSQSFASNSSSKANRSAQSSLTTIADSPDTTNLHESAIDLFKSSLDAFSNDPDSSELNLNVDNTSNEQRKEIHKYSEKLNLSHQTEILNDKKVIKLRKR
jgi:hypothetical protein